MAECNSINVIVLMEIGKFFIEGSKEYMLIEYLYFISEIKSFWAKNAFSKTT